MCICICVYTHIRIHMYTCIHAYTYMCLHVYGNAAEELFVLSLLLCSLCFVG